MEEGNKYIAMLWDYILKVGPNIMLAIIILFFGFWIIKKFVRFTSEIIKKAGFSREIVSFMGSLLDIGLKVMLFFVVAELVGIDTAGFVALLAAAGFAIGLSLQGSLGNFAAGIIILFFKPYRVGDWVEIKEKFGRVEDIQIFNTIVQTPGYKQLIIPNGQVISGIVTNFSTKGFIRMEISIFIPYSESFPKVRDIILKELRRINKVLVEPEPEIGIESFDSHSVVLSIRPYVIPDDYWEVHFIVHERIKSAFYSHNIKVAYSEGIELGNVGE
jgi:small conductance mechanosensitive channel